MAGLKSAFEGMKTFWVETLSEMRKTSWPGRQELMESTMIVIVTVVMLGVFVGLCDRFLVLLMKWVIPS